jgi:Na+/H+ antiporter NhaD/arsenite permease-like protein
MISAAVFCLTYIGIALGKIPGAGLDRTGIALLGAIGMVVFGVVTPEQAANAVDVSTILLLYALMIVSAQLRLGGFYTWAVLKSTFFLNHPRAFLFSVMVLSAVLSAILANDIVCLAFTPVLAVTLLTARVNPTPFLLGLAMASNIGSAATIIGNPQNMLIGQMGRLDFGEVSAISIAGLLLCSRKQKTRDILGLVDWHLITLFCALFILIHGILQSNGLHNLTAQLAGHGFDLRNLSVLTWTSTILSNIFSNVPAVMLLLPLLSPENPVQWYTLALSSTFAGNLFLLGSIANLIVVEQAAAAGIRITFKDHAVIGIPVTLVSLLILILWVSG